MIASVAPSGAPGEHPEGFALVGGYRHCRPCSTPRRGSSAPFRSGAGTDLLTNMNIWPLRGSLRFDVGRPDHLAASTASISSSMLNGHDLPRRSVCAYRSTSSWSGLILSLTCLLISRRFCGDRGLPAERISVKRRSRRTARPLPLQKRRMYLHRAITKNRSALNSLSWGTGPPWPLSAKAAAGADTLWCR
jgi:hypothetical protein